jgi:hypothetical protein
MYYRYDNHLLISRKGIITHKNNMQLNTPTNMNQPTSSSQFLDKQAGHNNQETHETYINYLSFSATLSL